MAKFGKVDYKQFQKLQKRLQEFDKLDRKKICEDSAKELGRSLIARVRKKTKPGEYPKSSGKIGGTLRRGWDTEQYPIHEGYQVDVFNDVKYAAYVEFGHRTRGHKGWVPGKHMLTRSEMEVQANTTKVVNKHIEKALRGLFDDK